MCLINWKWKPKCYLFNLLINNCKQIDTINSFNKNTAVANTDLVMFNSVQI